MKLAVINFILRLAGWITLLAMAFKSGRDKEQSDQLKETVENAETKLDIQDQLNAMHPDERRRLLDKWATVYPVVPDTPDKR